MKGTLTSKGQITIPVEARQRMGLRAGCRVEFVITDEGHMEVIPLSGSVTRLKGMVPRPSRAASLADMDRAIAEGSSR